MISLTRSLAVEWAPHGIHVNAIAPGMMKVVKHRPDLDETHLGQPGRTHADAADRHRRRPAWRRSVSVVGGVGLRHRPRAGGRWWLDRLVARHASAAAVRIDRLRPAGSRARRGARATSPAPTGGVQRPRSASLAAVEGGSGGGPLR